jgi:hypothetical protein
MEFVWQIMLFHWVAIILIIRYMRFRMGDKYQKGGMVDGNGGVMHLVV